MTSLMEHIQRIALLGVLQPDEDANLRKVFRWYSKTFHTPLSEVEELPLEHILINYFEEMYDDLDEEKQKEQIKLVLETPEERARREAEEEADEDEFMKEMEEEAAEQSKKVNTKLLKRPPLKSKKDPEIDIAINPDMLEAPIVEPEPEVKISIVDDLDDFGEADFIPSKPRK